ncbi:hypothetical protein BST30_01915 [Mycobacterium mantenii]|uniref:Uncharacterized protein n=1 Tax=Mycobacterium mantenii TaxID=560555 RepID=A0A1X0G5F1_MYCNT|nr:hypothetical protein BST30_01915 [Mycobacterium mantenii]
MVAGGHQVHIIEHAAVGRLLPRKASKGVAFALEFESSEGPIDDREVNSDFLTQPEFFHDSGRRVVGMLNDEMVPQGDAYVVVAH